jgi:hypothetical protein
MKLRCLTVPLQVDGEWKSEGSLEWHCLMPRARVRIAASS